MLGKDKPRNLEEVLGHVIDRRRDFLRRILAGAGAVLTLPMMTSTSVAWRPEEECYYWERKVKKGKWPGEYWIEVKKKKCPPDDFWGKGKKAKRVREFWKKDKKGPHWPDDFF